MKIVQYLGGLGNQMFQHAFYLAMKKIHGDAKADISQFQNYHLHNGFELDKAFGITAIQPSRLFIDLYYNPKRKYIFRKIRRLAGLKNSVYYEKEDFVYDAKAFSSSCQYFIGYWQNEKYFKSIESEIRGIFKFINKAEEFCPNYFKQIRDANAVGIHIRRGDYIDHPLLGNICGLTYYQKAIENILERIDHPLFFVFSNDIAWCKENITHKGIVFVESNSAIMDMELLSLCKHQIIANSSFSWWAAWLNPNPGKLVIAPDKWINSSDIKEGLIPANWIRI